MSEDDKNLQSPEYAWIYGPNSRCDAEAVRDCVEAANSGDVEAQYKFGVIHEHGIMGFQVDLVAAVKWYSFAAARKQPLASYALGKMYEAGRGGLPHDMSQAVAWYEMSAENGYTPACERLGNLYTHGWEGTPPNADLAKHWYLVSVYFSYDTADVINTLLNGTFEFADEDEADGDNEPPVWL